MTQRGGGDAGFNGTAGTPGDRSPERNPFAGRTAQQVLALLRDGDPFELHARCVERLRERALLVSLERVEPRVLARIAFFAARYDGSTGLNAWIIERIDEAVDDALDEDRSNEERGDLSIDVDAHSTVLSDVLGIDPLLGRRALIAFHAEPLEVRRAFWEHVLEGKTLHRIVAEGAGPPARARAALRRAFEVLGMPPDFTDEGGRT